MKNIILIFSLLISYNTYAQSNYSKLFDIDLNVEKTYLDAELIMNETWVVFLNGDWGTTITKFDSLGNKVLHKVIDGFSPAFDDMFTVTRDSIFIIGDHNSILRIDKKLNDYRIGKLRCFEQGDLYWNFGRLWPHVPCDTVYQEQVLVECTDHNLLCPGNIWHEVGWNMKGDAFPDKYKLSDTLELLSGKWYYEVLVSQEEFGEEWTGTKTYLREEGDKVWLYKYNKEGLLYDFGLSVKDTFNSISDGYDVSYIVDSIKMITLEDGSERKGLYLRCVEEHFEGWSMLWIEGVGYTGGLLNVYHACEFDFLSALVCLSQDGEVKYMMPKAKECWIVTAVFAIEDDIQVAIRPNPVSGLLYIDIEQSIDYIIYNGLGEVMLIGDAKIIDVSRLVDGLYFIQFYDKSRAIHTDKFVKM